MKRSILLLIIGILVLSGLEAVAINNENHSMKYGEIQHSFNFSPPILTERDNYLKLDLKESENFLTVTDKPEMPMFTHNFDLPFGVTNVDINCEVSRENEMILSHKIQPSPKAISRSSNVNKESLKLFEDKNVYSSEKLYPNNWYDYKITCGLDSHNKHVTHVSLYIYPVRYSPILNKICYIEDITINVKYDNPKIQMNFEEEYDLVIIAPEKFSSGLVDLISHKNDNGVATFLKTTEEIYDEYDGEDKPEQIKYFIKDAIETHNITYVLLVGGLKKYYNANDREDMNQGSEDWYVPVRYTNIQTDPSGSPDPYDPGTISDLYYADIYKQGGLFSSWDSNDDGIYANWDKFTGSPNDVLDLNPDVYLGRLACRNRFELSIVTKKIIDYEGTSPSSKPWLNTMVGIAGVSHAMHNGQPDGEYICDIAFDYMEDIIDDEVKVYASNNDTGGLIPVKGDILRAINGGTGYVLFEGHGNPLSWNTHPIEGTATWMGGIDMRSFWRLLNFKKLPFIIVGGCHDGQFNVTWYKTKNDNDYGNFYWTYGFPGCECFSWRLLTIPYGGAVASYGATGLTSSWVGQPVSLNGEIELNFFYKMGIEGVTTTGESIGSAIEKFIDENAVAVVEAHCITIVHLFGDPSLQLGGYE